MLIQPDKIEILIKGSYIITYNVQYNVYNPMIRIDDILFVFHPLEKELKIIDNQTKNIAQTILGISDLNNALENFFTQNLVLCVGSKKEKLIYNKEIKSFEVI